MTDAPDPNARAHNRFKKEPRVSDSSTLNEPAKPHAAAASESFQQTADRLTAQADALLNDPARREQAAMPGETFVLGDTDVLALPRDNGDSRYPYGRDGYNFWVYASGYMHSNEGLFSHFLRAAEGQEPNIAFFAGLPNPDGTYQPVPLLHVPRVAASEPEGITRYTVMSSTATHYVVQTHDLRFVVRVFVTPDNEVVFSLLATNRSQQPQQFYLSSFINPFLRNQLFESSEDRWFKEVRALSPDPAQGHLGSFRVKVNEDKDRTTSISHYGIVRRHLTLGPASKLNAHEETTSRYQYVGGSRGSLHNPPALRAGTFGDPQPICTFVQDSIAGDLIHLELAPGETARLDTPFDYTMDRGKADQLAAATVDPTDVDAQLHAVRQDDAARHSAIALKFGPADDDSIQPKVFNAFLEHLKRQVEFCALIKGYIQLAINSLIGIRDVFQAIEAQLFWQPDAARAKMLEALDYTAPDGRCFRQYSLPTSSGAIGRMDLRPFIDQGVWVISTIATYLRATGDRAFLDEQCGYHQILDEASRSVLPLDTRDSVLEHLCKIMDFLLAHRDHDQTGCVRAMFGDWNDALDGLGVSQDPLKEYGTGVTVMATLQVYQNCHEMIEILSARPGQDERVATYKQAAEEIAAGLTEHAIVTDREDNQRIVHGWGDKKSYLVGGYHDPDGQARDGLTSNAFWAISGMLDRDPSLANTILAAYERLDSKYGYKTFEPYFPEDTPGVGRIVKLPAGTAENGATYIHATAFAVWGLFRMGRPREAWDQMIKILPFTDIHDNLSHSPFVMPNSYGYNPEKLIDGQNMNDWQTGSSNVVLKVLIWYVFGIEPAADGLWVQPAAWSPFNSFDATIPVRGCRVRVKGTYTDGQTTRTYKVNGTRREAVQDPMLGVDKLWIPADQLKQPSIEIEMTQ